MRKINKITAILALFTATLAAGCTGEFEYFNTNHHEATEEQLEQDNLKTGAFFRQLQRTVIYFKYGSTDSFTDGIYQETQNLTADSFAGYLTATLDANGGYDTGSYVMQPQQWINRQFDWSFTYTMSAWKSLTEAAEELGMPEIAALGTVVKVAAMHRTADYYGPLPYTSFGSGEISNTYDTLEEVYNKFFEELDESIDILTNYAATATSIMADYDYVYGGDVTKWIKFANTLRLRLAMRVVYADETLAKTEAMKSLDHPIGCLSVAGDAAKLNRTADISTYHHPLYEIVTSFGNGGGETIMSASMDLYLNGYKDPRREVYFNTAPSDGQYHGVRAGLAGLADFSVLRHTSGYISWPKVDNNQMSIVWMYTSESLFLQAEAALRGWTGDAQTLYNAAVAMSFEERGVAIGSYMSTAGGNFNYTAVSAVSGFSPSTTTQTRISSVPTVAWNNSNTFEQNLERIAIQRWIATYPNGAEGWAIVRRTGYPRLLPIANNQSGGSVGSNDVIRRLILPYSEKENNPAGYASGQAALGGDDTPGTRLWWDCK